MCKYCLVYSGVVYQSSVGVAFYLYQHAQVYTSILVYNLMNEFWEEGKQSVEKLVS